MSIFYIYLIIALTISPIFGIPLQSVYEEAEPANGYDKYLILDPNIIYTGEIGVYEGGSALTALNYLNPNRVYCNEPMLGKGFVQTEHGKLSVPPPAVIELIKQKYT